MGLPAGSSSAVSTRNPWCTANCNDWSHFQIKADRRTTGFSPPPRTALAPWTDSGGSGGGSMRNRSAVGSGWDPSLRHHPWSLVLLQIWPHRAEKRTPRRKPPNRIDLTITLDFEVQTNGVSLVSRGRQLKRPQVGVLAAKARQNGVIARK